ncbi:MAG: glycoside hydrolase family 76 protein [Muribaculaceae bacterium]|nr:glycoside hydrolase family 76 protein [Muribaculaceae bacterium]
MKSIYILSAAVAMALCTACSSNKEAAALPGTTLSINDVWQAYDAFNTVYLDSAKYIYRNTNLDPHATDRFNGAAAIWCQPMYVDMAMNAAALARTVGDSARIEQYDTLTRQLLEGNIAQFLDFDFDICEESRGWFIYDDIQWWTITLARAYLATGDERYRELAEKSFARVWYGSPVVGDTGSYADPAKDLGGGMFWQWQPLHHPKVNEAGHGKMSCINFPTVVAAMLLYQAAPADREADANPIVWTNEYGTFTRPAYETKDRYLEMAREIYDWSVKNLAELPEGKVHDNRHGDSVGGHPLIYNQGTFIGASALLYLATGDQSYLDNARAGADYSINTMSADHGMLPWAHNHRHPYDQGSLEQGVYPAIWCQYMSLLTDECGQKDYLPFLVRNIEAGWANRQAATDICDGEAWAVTPSDTIIGSYAASSTPALMLTTANSLKK